MLIIKSTSHIDSFRTENAEITCRDSSMELDGPPSMAFPPFSATPTLNHLLDRIRGAQVNGL